MSNDRLSPIRSTREDDAEVAPAIDRFVVGLGEWIDDLQDAHAAGNLAGVRSLADAHAEEAAQLGYPVLAEGAGEVASAAKEGEAEASRKAISDLIEVVQRIRLGHRSAA